MTSRKLGKYTAQEKREAVKLAAEMGPTEAARRLGIPSGTVTCWRFLAHKEAAQNKLVNYTSTEPLKVAAGSGS
jgi:transposase-like protein